MQLVINTIEDESKFRLFDLHDFRIISDLAEFFIVGREKDFKDIDGKNISAKVINNNMSFLVKGTAKLDCFCDESYYGADLYVIEVKSENPYMLVDKLEYKFDGEIGQSLDVVDFIIDSGYISVVLKTNNNDKLLTTMQRKNKCKCTLNLVKQEIFNKKLSLIKKQIKDFDKDVELFIDEVRENEVIWWLTIGY